MKEWLKISILALALVVASLQIAAAGWEAGMEVPSLDEYSLSGDVPSLEGKVTLIDFWASWCAPCKAAFPEMDNLYQEFGDKGFQIIAVSVDQKERSMQQFLDRRKPSFTTVHDGSQKLVEQAGIQVMPTSFMVDKKGVIRFVHEGWHGKKSAENLNEEIQTLLAE
jgi:thiol-disulfide isomerase/thioredoxin